MEIITSLNNNKIKDYAKLLDKKYRDNTNLFLVEGEHLVNEAYQSNYLKEIICTEKYVNLLPNINKILVTKEVINKLSNTKTPQEIIGIVNKKEDKPIGDKVLILDNIQDPGNLGTIIRSSVAFNIDTIIISNNTVDIYNDKVIRSTQGMLFKINIIRRDLNNIIDELHNNNYIIYGTKVDNGTNIKDITFNNKFAIIMGNEGNGVSNELLNKCDKYLYINMNNNCESLNVAVATSIILYEMNR